MKVENLGYALAHAYGAVFDNPDLIACCVVGDGEAETGPLATSWHANKFLNPVTDGAVLPILHLNGYKIANPTVLARIPKEELESLFIGYGYKPYFVEGDDPLAVHECHCHHIRYHHCPKLKQIKKKLANGASKDCPQWPMIILRTPKGWTGPKFVDGVPIESTFRAHQVPLSDFANKPEHIKILEDWMHSYKPQELFDQQGSLIKELRQLSSRGRTAHERQSSYQWWPITERFASAGFC